MRKLRCFCWISCFYWITSVLQVLLLLPSLHAADWPQILGPQRDGQSQEKLPPQAKNSPPVLKWKFKLGQGYAGPAIADRQVFVFHRFEGMERLDCLAADDGRPLWNVVFEANYRGGIDPDSGPRCVPVVNGKTVFLFGAGGDCHAVESASGRKIWSRSLGTDYQAPEGYFGFGSTPLVIGNTLLVNVGGKKAGIVGLRCDAGETVFAIGREQASYASPVAVKRNDATQALFISRLHFLSVDPQSGRETILVPFGRSGPTVNAAVPLVRGDEVFLTASYGVGAMQLSLTKPAAANWASDEALSSQYSTPVRQGEFLFGIHGREDIPPAHLRCVEWSTGKVRWSRDDFGVAHFIALGEDLLAITIEGELVVFPADPAGYREWTRQRISRHTTRALPAFSNGHLFVRNNNGQQGELLCLGWEGN